MELRNPVKLYLQMATGILKLEQICPIRSPVCYPANFQSEAVQIQATAAAYKVSLTRPNAPDPSTFAKINPS